MAYFVSEVEVERLSLVTWNQRLFQLAVVGAGDVLLELTYYLLEKDGVWDGIYMGCNYPAIIWNLANNQRVCEKGPQMP